MLIDCVYDKTLYRDEKMGDTLFTVFPISSSGRQFIRNIVCKGVIPRYPEKVPLRLNLSKGTDDSYNVWMSTLYAADEKSVLDFLSSDYFDGIGPAKAKKFIKEYGYDIFKCSCKDDFPVIFENVNKLKVFQELLFIIEKNGGTYHQAYRIFKRYGDSSLNILSENPYIACDILPFSIADKYAQSVGVDRYSDKRIEAILDESLKKIEMRGDTCVEMGDFCRLVSGIDDKISPFYVLGTVLGNNKYVLENEKLNIYDSQLYLSEENIAFNIARLQSGSKIHLPFDEELMHQIEYEIGTVYNDEQLKAVKLIESTGIKVITGGPGTGKTTVINGIIRYIKAKYPDKTIALTAPTANAARRIREKTGENAITLHKFLEIQPFADSQKFSFKDISEDFVIIDESSFIDTRLASIILQSLKKTATVIFVGDVDQLPSVGAGMVFKDIIDSGRVEVVRLEKIFRQSGGSSIIENAVRIKNGDIKLQTDDNFQIIRFENEEDLFEKAVSLMNENYDIKNPYSVRLYTPIKKRKYKCCTHMFNKELQKYFSSKDDYFVYGYTKFYIGDPVIFTHNNYKTGYLNGDEGKIVQILMNENEKVGVKVQLQEETVEIKGDDLLDMELSFAITTHKSQGSECEISIVVVPQNPKNMQYRSIIYVASTRAKKKTIILSEGSALEKSIRNDKKNTRNTGLKEFLLQKVRSIPHN